ncbi:MAG: hypothetical protein IRZ16_14440 [Myxococcaceae bacterium]|nr:hypothetical protein [Myxococcaceae bacterium]
MLAFALLSAILLSSAPAATDDCLAPQEDGSTFPICFDPGRGLELGAGAAWTPRTTTGAGEGVTLELRAAILLRSGRESHSKRGSLWFFEQRLLTVVAQPFPVLQDFELTAYEGTFRRHLREGFILVPAARPLRLPFPFDVALHAQVGTVERRVFDGPGVRIGVGSAALMIDPIRSTSGRLRLSFGPAMRYDLRTDGTVWVHEISPFTGARLEAVAETDDGWWAARIEGEGGWSAIPGQGAFLHGRAVARLERLVLAVNDQPVWIQAEVRAAYRDAGPYRRTELSGSLALVMRAFQ